MLSPWSTSLNILGGDEQSYTVPVLSLSRRHDADMDNPKLIAMKSEWMRAFDDALIRFTGSRTRIQSFEQLEARLSEVALACFQVAPTRFRGFKIHFNDLEPDAEFMDPHYDPTTGTVHISDADAVHINTLLHRASALTTPGTAVGGGVQNAREGEALVVYEIVCKKNRAEKSEHEHYATM
jgi:hypothetical protein